MTYIGPPFPWQLQTTRDALFWVAQERAAEIGTAPSPPASVGLTSRQEDLYPPQWPWGMTVPMVNQDQLYLPEK